MNKKRLNRDLWGFHVFPYYQMRIDCDEFHGIACVVNIIDGEFQYWNMPIAGKTAVCGKGMTWLQLIPDGKKRVITAMYFKDGAVDASRVNYPVWGREELCPSAWYIDVIEDTELDENGIVMFVDKYLDVIFSPEGDVKVDDRDELDAAFESGELTKVQYDEALAEGDAILKEMCEDIHATAHFCATVCRIVNQKIKEGLKPFYLFHGSQYKFDVVKPQQSHGACERESMQAIYAAESLRDAAPFAIPLRWYPDEPGGKRAFTCDAGKTYIEYGFVDMTRDGYVYTVKSDSFEKIDEWLWVSKEEVVPMNVLTIPAKRLVMDATFSDEAMKIQQSLFPLENYTE